MEEKKRETKDVSKIVIAVVVLIIVVLAVALGKYYYYNNIKKEKGQVSNFQNNDLNVILKQKENEIAEQKKQIEELKSNIKEKQDNSIKESEALKLGKEKYDDATKLYWGRLDYNEKDTIDEGLYSKITNSDIIKMTFSKNGLYQYLRTNTFVRVYNGDYYRVNADRGGDITYRGNELKVKDINENKILFISIEKYNNDIDSIDENLITHEIENLFSIVKEEGIWKVESYTLPN